ncbi:MAG: hypothetical protein A0129_14475 [Limnobacter sp. CACIAM 66H1]|nr:MAG: hypothetical protein A0129_14475 [Limnobacter sp. CACIAM 66H1]
MYARRSRHDRRFVRNDADKVFRSSCTYTGSLAQIGEGFNKKQGADDRQKEMIKPHRLIERERLQEGFVEERYWTHGVTNEV